LKGVVSCSDFRAFRSPSKGEIGIVEKKKKELTRPKSGLWENIIGRAAELSFTGQTGD
jgi:hypothetical protein